MKTPIRRLALLTLPVVLLLPGCVYDYAVRDPHRHPHAARVAVVEHGPHARGRWVEGHWALRGRRHVWVPGVWIAR